MKADRAKEIVPADIATRIKALRGRLDLTQAALADLIGVSFASVNRWENGQSVPLPVVIRKILAAEKIGLRAFDGPEELLQFKEEPAQYQGSDGRQVQLDFGGNPDAVRLVVEAERLSFGHLFDPSFAAETSLVDPLPHQLIAVYQHMLVQPRLRFLLADDAGAGKTIMTGLYIREMLLRRLIRRILIVAPAGLVGNWESEMRSLFSLPFRIVAGQDSRDENPFSGTSSDMVIVSIDTLAEEPSFSRLQEKPTVSYDLVVFDEAHKLSADRDPELRERKTRRYRLAEALAGVPTKDHRWHLDWSCRHLLLLTATPHMGKDYPYYCLWRLLEPEALQTYDSFEAYPVDERRRHFLRRAKEEMVFMDGRPMYPKRTSATLEYPLSHSEQALYNRTTEYIRTYYNLAQLLNRSAARLAMSVFQRRLASSTYALIRSFERRLLRLDQLVQDVISGKVTIEQILSTQARRRNRALLDETTADEEESREGLEENEVDEDDLLGGIVATSLAQLEVERSTVRDLLNMARSVHDRGEESKLEKLAEVIRHPDYAGQKIIVFTEYRDTLEFIVRRLEGMGFAGRVASIHGGMGYREREAQVRFFRSPSGAGGADFLVATDAAGEGINLQFCWLMVNYDIPWNPARLEQRMGRIHRYGQKHDVVIVNLVSSSTREGRVLKTLLDKLERICHELGSDKVFDVIGQLFKDIPITEFMEQAVAKDDILTIENRIAGSLTSQQVVALQERQRALFGGGDVAPELPALRAAREKQAYQKLLPGYVLRFVEDSARLLGFVVEGDSSQVFRLSASRAGSLDSLWPILEEYPQAKQGLFSVYPVDKWSEAVFLRPGDLFFDGLVELVLSRYGRDALRGAVFSDPNASTPYLFCVARVCLAGRPPDAGAPGVGTRQLEQRLVGIKVTESGLAEVLPVEHLMLLKGSAGDHVRAMSLVAKSISLEETALEYIKNSVQQGWAHEKRSVLLSEVRRNEPLVKRGWAYAEAELARQRSKLAEQAREGDGRAARDLEQVKERQRELARRKAESLQRLAQDVETVEPGEVELIAHALIVPAAGEEEKRRFEDEVERVAIQVSQGFERALGSIVEDVSNASKARAAGLIDWPGFDLLSTRPDGAELDIEVKGRAGRTPIELTENEWAKACNLRDRYWLYVVLDCGTSAPQLHRVQDPFARLLAHPKTGFVIEAELIIQVAKRGS